MKFEVQRKLNDGLSEASPLVFEWLEGEGDPIGDLADYVESELQETDSMFHRGITLPVDGEIILRRVA